MAAPLFFTFILIAEKEKSWIDCFLSAWREERSRASCQIGRLSLNNFIYLMYLFLGACLNGYSTDLFHSGKEKMLSATNQSKHT